MTFDIYTVNPPGVPENVHVFFVYSRFNVLWEILWNFLHYKFISSAVIASEISWEATSIFLKTVIKTKGFGKAILMLINVCDAVMPNAGFHERKIHNIQFVMPCMQRRTFNIFYNYPLRTYKFNFQNYLSRKYQWRRMETTLALPL